jgi:hypothetical protein
MIDIVPCETTCLFAMSLNTNLHRYHGRAADDSLYARELTPPTGKPLPPNLARRSWGPW